MPGNFEIPDIIKEAWEKNKNKILQQQQPKKKPTVETQPVQTKVLHESLKLFLLK